MVFPPGWNIVQEIQHTYPRRWYILCIPVIHWKYAYSCTPVCTLQQIRRLFWKNYLTREPFRIKIKIDAQRERERERKREREREREREKTYVFLLINDTHIWVGERPLKDVEKQSDEWSWFNSQLYYGMFTQ